MDSKLVLFQCIALLYRESQLEKRATDSRDLIKEAIGTIRLPEPGVAVDHTRETLVALRSTVLYMVDQPSDFNFDKTHILDRIRVACGPDIAMFSVYEKGFEDLESDEQIKRKIIHARQDLQSYMREIKIKAVEL